MKANVLKTSFLTAGICLLLNVAGRASENDPKPGLKETVKVISSQIKFPGELDKTGAQEKVNVTFMVNESGEINFVIANTHNVNLKQDIESQFRKLTLTKLKPNNAYSIVLNFKIV